MLDSIYLDWYLLFLPVAFIHGWLVGRKEGVRKGSSAMFDHMYDAGQPVQGKRHTRQIEITLDD